MVNFHRAVYRYLSDIATTEPELITTGYIKEEAYIWYEEAWKNQVQCNGKLLSWDEFWSRIKITLWHLKEKGIINADLTWATEECMEWQEKNITDDFCCPHFTHIKDKVRGIHLHLCSSMLPDLLLLPCPYKPEGALSCPRRTKL